MDPSNWKRIKELFAAALEMPTNEQADFVSRLDAGIRGEVQKLLIANADAGDFISAPAMIGFGSVENQGSDDVPEQIDEYHILRQIGAGGMGTVFLAEHTGEGFTQRVALKLIKRGMDTSAVLNRFLMERQILANLEHPNIARMLDGGTTADGLPYFVMEYVEGDEIRKYAVNNGLGLKDRLGLFQKVCSAVASAHQKLIVHRDIKPTNILVTSDGDPKLLDFGIAKLISPDWDPDAGESTLTQFRIMTPEYASPEQIAGEPTTTSTDVYSLGVVLYELLTGHRPYVSKDRSPKEIVNNVLTSEPPKPSVVISERFPQSRGRTKKNGGGETIVSESDTGATAAVEPRLLRGDLDNIILKALRREPDRRYQSVQEFSADISRYLDGLPVKATADSPMYRFRKFYSRHRTGLIAAAAAMLLLIAATGVSVWQYYVARNERIKAERRFEETRRLAKSMLYELYDAIDAIPGSTKAKELLASKAIEYLDRLTAEGNNDPYLLTELADGYQRIGDIQGGLNRANLGQSGEAKNSYAKAQSLREAVVASGASDPKFQIKLAMAYAKAAESDYNEANVQGYYANQLRSLETLKALEKLLPDDEDYLFELGASYANTGRAATLNGNVDEAIEYFEKADAILADLHQRNTSDLVRTMAVSTVNDMIAELHAAFGRREEARYYLKRSASFVLPLLQANPDNAELYRSSAVSYYSIAQNECELGNYDEAKVNAEKGLELAESLLKRDDQNFDVSILYAALLYSRAKILVRSGHAAEGLPILQDVLRRAKDLQARDPENEIIPVRIAYVDDEIGRAYLVIGLSATNKIAKITALQKARSSLQQAYDSYERYGNVMVGREAEVKDEVAAKITQCDAALKLASAK